MEVPNLSARAKCARTRLDKYITSRESCVLSVSIFSNSSASNRGIPVTVSARYLPRLMSGGLLPACMTATGNFSSPASAAHFHKYNGLIFRLMYHFIRQDCLIVLVGQSVHDTGLTARLCWWGKVYTTEV